MNNEKRNSILISEIGTDNEHYMTQQKSIIDELNNRHNLGEHLFIMIVTLDKNDKSTIMCVNTLPLEMIPEILYSIDDVKSKFIETSLELLDRFKDK